MTSAREEVLSRIRAAVAGAPALPALGRDYRIAGDQSASIPLFVERLQDYRAAVHQVESDELPAALGRIVRGRVVVPAGVPVEWLGRLDVVVDDPPLSAADLDRVDAVLTTCALGIAETGTAVLDAGSGQGRRALTLVPGHHVLVVRAEQVVATVPQAVAQLDPRRPQTWISGPSATSDIELQRVEGVHGPRRLDVVMIHATREYLPPSG